MPSSDGSGRLARRLDAGLAAAIFVATFVAALHRLRFGLSPQDEAFYLATAQRYALGDLPFRDEVFNPARMYDVLLAPLFAAWPSLGALELRIGWLAVEAVTAIALFVLLRRYASASVVAAGCCAAMFLPNLAWTPAYHLMGTFFFVLAWTLWLLGCRAGDLVRATSLGAAAGVAFGIGAITYLPLLALGIVPFAVAIRLVVAPRWAGPRSVSTLALLTTLGAVVLFALILVGVSGLGGDWLDAQRRIATVSLYAMPASAKLGMLLGELRAIVPTAFGGLLLGAVLLGWMRLPIDRAGPVGLLSGVVLVVAVCAALRWMLAHAAPSDHLPVLFHAFGTVPMRVFAVSVIGVAAGLALDGRRPEHAGDGGDWRFVAGALLAGGLGFAFLQGYLSGQTFKVMFGAVPLIPLALVQLERLLVGRGVARSERAWASGAALAVGLVLLLTVVGHRYEVVYQRGPLAMLVAEFEHPRLRGIRDIPRFVESIESVAAALEGSVRPGDLLLAYDHAALVYFVTSTRPALDHAWTYKQLPARLRRQSVRRMIEAGRVPEYAVQNLEYDYFDGVMRDPVHAFVAKRYAPIAEVGGFRIWRLVGPRDAAEGPAKPDRR